MCRWAKPKSSGWQYGQIILASHFVNRIDVLGGDSPTSRVKTWPLAARRFGPRTERRSRNSLTVLAFRAWNRKSRRAAWEAQARGAGTELAPFLPGGTDLFSCGWA